MADVVTKILDIQINVDKAIEKTVEYKKEVQRLREEQAELRREQKEDPANAEKYGRDIENLAAQIAVYNDAIRKNTKVVQNQLRQEESQKGSLVSMRAELSNLTAEYDALGEAQRRGTEGVELKQRINDITTALKAEEEATQRYYRNVGNYENAVRDALGSLNIQITEAQRKYADLLKTEGSTSEATKKAKKEFDDLQLTLKFTEETTESFKNAVYGFIPGGNLVMKLLPLLNSGLSGVGQAFRLAGQGASMLGKQLLALMANPIVAFLGMMAAAIMLVVNGIKNSEDNMNQWNRILAPLQRGLAALQGVLTTLAGWILNVVEFSGRMLGAMMKLAEAATSIFPSISKAIHNVNAATERAIELANEEAQLAKDNRAFLVEEAKSELEVAKLKQQAMDSSLDVNERLKANQEAVAREQALADERLRLAQKEFDILKERASWADNDAETNQKLADAEANLYRAQKSYYDSTMRLNKQRESLEKEIASEREKAHEEYKKQMAERIRLAEEASQKEAAAYRMLEDALLQLVEEGFDKKRQSINLQYDREIEDLQKRLDTEKNLTESARQAINDTIIAKEQQRQQELNSISEEEIQKEVERQEKLISTRLAAVEKGSKEERELRLMQLEISKQLELAQYEDDEEMKTAILAKYAQERLDIVKEYSDAEQKQQEEQAQKEQELLEKKKKANEESVKTLSDGMKALGEHNKAFAKMSKIVALGEIAVNTGKALASGIAVASDTAPFPANLAAIATTVGTVLANIASAISTVKSAKFATGGKVTGAGTGTSDSIPAWLSNGEFVINAKATSRNEPLLRAINSGAQPTVILPSSYGGSTSYAQSAEQGKSLVEAIENIRPVVTVEDINDGQARVRVIENLDNI